MKATVEENIGYSNSTRAYDEQLINNYPKMKNPNFKDNDNNSFFYRMNNIGNFNGNINNNIIDTDNRKNLGSFTTANHKLKSKREPSCGETDNTNTTINNNSTNTTANTNTNSYSDINRLRMPKSKSSNKSKIDNNIPSTNEIMDDHLMMNNGDDYTESKSAMDDNKIGSSNKHININNANVNAMTNKQILFNNSVYSNRHTINDLSIQEALSPFFQPFGVDVSHLPMTNPPIFQTSSMMYDDPGRRRRISISNGQISQLGEDLETLDNLYDSQPPPMPHKFDMHNRQQVQLDHQPIPQQLQEQMQQQLQQQLLQQNYPVNMIPQGQYPHQFQDFPNNRNNFENNNNTNTNNNDIPNGSNGSHSSADSNASQFNSIKRSDSGTSPLTTAEENNMPRDIYYKNIKVNSTNENRKDYSGNDLGLQKPINDGQNVLANKNYTTHIKRGEQDFEVPDEQMKVSLSQQYQIQHQQMEQLALSNQQQHHQQQQQQMPMQVPPSLNMGAKQQMYMSNHDNDMHMNYHQGQLKNSSQLDSMSPGTASWKRTRLLERNRIAASKCRQRKKFAQLQLQKDYDEIRNENRVMKRKLEYYEKLVSKFKKFSEAHLRKCDSNKESLKIIEEMLMIDSGIAEVNETGIVVKIEK
ncbi:hypothetical protein TPHA_0C01320 [Tetrapisispora phaffii CBS 4417]|uniref:BZIP domain-containing protein n=1 Tax=Tetrapisispora phaffii (strain ATCC 24235 / CBS 4417 / NBRC 1672 / NRRL Y-8282 / UCD 70-5) TaxID=1071381 RepID=G8BRB2_TETPH|nr:hypothetical protein TPHA_0C01320 [Tetrapisispora phaffii CBS 4417]CCE62288.1 hypothetical protein TPHA_0C01320 [Tetrapisispora phaffii CBS 4417]